MKHRLKALFAIFVFALASDQLLAMNGYQLLSDDKEVEEPNYAVKRLLYASKESSDALQEVLKEERLSIDTKNSKGDTALMLAAVNNMNRALENLLLQGANPNVRNDQNYTPLMMAILGDNIDGATILLENGAFVNAKSTIGTRALDTAINRANLAAMKFLISNEADVNTEDKYGYNPLMRATELNFKDGVELLLQNDAQRRSDALKLAKMYRFRDLIELFRQYGVNK
jgi:ankyrin repeat protein